jgi:choline dehydrogenase-like flavoprotein
MLRADLPWVPESGRNWLARHSVDWWVMSEDLPVSENRIRIDGPTPISIDWRPNNLIPHAALVSEMRNLCRRMGFRKVLAKRMGIAVTSHQCGTVRIGTDPSQAPLDRECRAFDVSNLYVVDGSVFPSSAAVNPTLTIVAMALRVATKIWDSTEVRSLKADPDRQGSDG